MSRTAERRSVAPVAQRPGIILKSRREIELMRRAGRVVHQVLSRMRELAAPGVTTAELNAVAEELIDNGSIYWVVKRFVRVRQFILAIEPITNSEGRRRCRIQLDPTLTRTELHPHRAFQGWRYLKPEDAPPDLKGDPNAETNIEFPPEMAAELRDLGLL